MKKFNISSLLILIASFAVTSASAQTQPSAPQKDVKSESVKTGPAPAKSVSAVSTEKKVEPITDGIINVKDEPKYFEQKKEKEKKNIEQQTDTPK